MFGAIRLFTTISVLYGFTSRGAAEGAVRENGQGLLSLRNQSMQSGSDCPISPNPPQPRGIRHTAYDMQPCRCRGGAKKPGMAPADRRFNLTTRSCTRPRARWGTPAPASRCYNRRCRYLPEGLVVRLQSEGAETQGKNIRI